MSKVKKICFYSILSSGHLNVCSSIGKVLLDNHPDFEVYFVVDRQWYERLSKLDSRFKFGVFNYDDSNTQLRMANIVQKLENTLKMTFIDKLKTTWKMFIQDETLEEVDRKSEEKIKEINPDFLICDQGMHLPAMVKSGVPYAFLASMNPLFFQIDNFPMLGLDLKSDDKEGIEKYKAELLPFRIEMRKYMAGLFERRNAKYKNDKIPIDVIRSDHFSLYTYPKEVDYYSEDLKKEYKLWQIDTPLYPQRIPKPYELPEEFKNLPGEIVYVSLGSLFSLYTHLIQRLVDMLEKLPYRYIVSKGMNGDKLKFPSSKFIGENYIDQLSVLRISSAMISHGGNNTFGECFYFGVPQLIMPVIGDQITNGIRLEETGYGFQLDLLNCTEEQLADRLNKLLTDEELRTKLKKASERIQKENRIVSVVHKIADYVENLQLQNGKN